MKLQPGSDTDTGKSVRAESIPAEPWGRDAATWWRPFIFGIAITLFSIVAFLAVAIGAAMLPETVRVSVTTAAASPLFRAFVSTLVAAFAGTWGAQLLAERMAHRRETLAEIHATNAAIGFAFNIANTYLGTKMQFVRDYAKKYEMMRVAWMKHLEGARVGRRDGDSFRYSVDLKKFNVPFLPINHLQAVMTEKISPGRALLLLPPLIQSIQGFADTVEQHNAWIDEFRRLPDTDASLRAHMYFGTPFATGRTDEQYPKLIEALVNQTDDCIAFSILVTKELRKYGHRLTARYGRGAPVIAAPQFDPAGDLLPDMASYSDFVSNTPSSSDQPTRVTK